MIDYIRETFTYRNDGVLIKKSNGKVFKSKSINRYGHVSLKDSGEWKTQSLHRVIWMYHHGAIPAHLVVDHRDRVKGNNMIENLRLVSKKQSLRNTPLINKRRKLNLEKQVVNGLPLSMHTNIRWSPKREQWIVFYEDKEGRKVLIGRSINLDRAVRMYEEWKQEEAAIDKIERLLGY